MSERVYRCGTVIHRFGKNVQVRRPWAQGGRPVSLLDSQIPAHIPEIYDRKVPISPMVEVPPARTVNNSVVSRLIPFVQECAGM